VSARAAVILVSREACTVGVYVRQSRGTLARTRAGAVALPAGRRLPDAAAVREALKALLSRPGVRRADLRLVALRAGLGGAAWWAEAAALAARHGAEALVLDHEHEARALFVGALHGTPCQDGLAVELDGGGVMVARFRGRVLATAERLRSPADLAGAAIVPLGPDDALVVSGAAVEALDGARGPARLTRAALRRLGDSRAHRALKRGMRALLDRAGRDEAEIARSALGLGLASALLRTAAPEVR
jgi:hypothetical protein